MTSHLTKHFVTSVSLQCYLDFANMLHNSFSVGFVSVGVKLIWVESLESGFRFVFSVSNYEGYTGCTICEELVLIFSLMIVFSLSRLDSEEISRVLAWVHLYACIHLPRISEIYKFIILFHFCCFMCFCRTFAHTI